MLTKLALEQAQDAERKLLDVDAVHALNAGEPPFRVCKPGHVMPADEEKKELWTHTSAGPRHDGILECKLCGYDGGGWFTTAPDEGVHIEYEGALP